MIVAVVLAGGQSRRMGVDKAGVVLRGRPLLHHVLDRLRPQAEALAVSGGRDPDRLRAGTVPVLRDGEGEGPLAGVLAGLEWAEGLGADVLLTAPVDTPFLPEDFAARLLPLRLRPAYAAGPEREHPLLAAWPVTKGLLARSLRLWLCGLSDPGGRRSVKAFHTWSGGRVVHWDSEAPFRNLNTPAELAEAEASLA